MTRPSVSTRALLPSTARCLKRNTRALHLSAPSRALDTPANASLSTVNASEIAHFSRLSAQWWDESGEFGLLHRMNPLRMQYIRNKVLEVQRDDGIEDLDAEKAIHPLRGLRALDVGCGGGLLSEVRSHSFTEKRCR